jgi:glutathione synthase/RimK-type ligase-like ATP-grasp enzyme
MGLAVLMSRACAGEPLTGIAKQLMERIKQHPRDANALMDLSIISHLWFNHPIGLSTQAQALLIRRLYRLPSASAKPLRLLALMQYGDLAANMPLEFLVQNSDIDLQMFYLDAKGLPDAVPEHDLLIVAIAESERSKPLLEQLARHMHAWPKPVINRPERIARLSRDSVSAMLQNLPGIAIPLTVQINRDEFSRLNEQSLAYVLTDGKFPIIARPLDSHAGHGLEKIDSVEQIAAYLQKRAESTFAISRFVDYRDADGWYRKYRVVLVDGQAYAGHMAISEHWMIHYLNAQMSESQQKRDEEARFMQEFDGAFSRRHAEALGAMHRAAGLDYLVIDCAEAPDGRLLVFEIDSAAVIHAMDSERLFPYKRAQAKRVFAAFQSLLQRISTASAE